MDIGYQANKETRPLVHNANRRADSIPRGCNNLRIHFDKQLTNNNKQMKIDKLITALQAAKKNGNKNIVVMDDNWNTYEFRISELDDQFCIVIEPDDSEDCE